MPKPIWHVRAQAAAAAWSAIPEELRSLVGPDDDRAEVAFSLTALRAAGLDVTKPDVFALAIEGARARTSVPQHEPAVIPLLMAPVGNHDPAVYYARVGNRVKIGYSINVRRRIYNLGAEELLATEPGGPEREAQRHQQFAHLRTHGEWFRLEEPLLTHIAELAVRAVA